MRKILSCCCLLLLVACHRQKPADQSVNSGINNQPAYTGQHFTADSPRLLTIVNWNIEWLGSRNNGPRNKALQMENSIKILKYLHADLYCLCEIVDPADLKKLTHALGPQYQFRISNYASGANSPSDPAYKEAQKLAFIYDTSIFKNVKTQAYLQADPRAGYNFAGGRYPFLLKANIDVNKTTESLAVFLLHAKSGADRTSYGRRLDAANTLKKAVNQEFSQKPIMILGDFNDEMTESIATGKPSPYHAFNQDPNYEVLTWAAEEQGDQSTLDYPTVIDQQIISSALNKYYVANSIHIRKDISSVVKDFSKGTTSDHYPVSSQFLINQPSQAKSPLPGTPHAAANRSATKQTPNTTTATPNTSANKNQKEAANLFRAYIQQKRILLTPARKAENIQFILYNANNRKVLSVHRKYINQGDTFPLRTPALYPSHYELVIFSKAGKQVIKFNKK